LPLVLGVLSIEKARRYKTRARDTATLLDFYQRRLARVRHEWMAKGDGGSDLETPDHLSNRDLDLFGDGSMFELLCDVDTPGNVGAVASVPSVSPGSDFSSAGRKLLA
jgi:hypothetical protein